MGHNRRALLMAVALACGIALAPPAPGPAPAHAASTAVKTYPDLPGLPTSVDLSRWDLPAGDQGTLGSCAAWATIYSLAGWYANRYHIPGAPYAPMPSYRAELAAGSGPSSIVANLAGGMQGLIPMGLYPQGNYDATTGLTPAEQRIMGAYHLTGWYLVYAPPAPDTSSEYYHAAGAARRAIEAALARGIPVAIRVAFFDAMTELDAGHAYAGLEMGASGSAGSHAVFASRYDAHGLWIENEWGLDWGRDGYAELSWDFVDRYVEEVVAITGIAAAGAAPVPTVTPGPPRAQVSSTLRPGNAVTLRGAGFTPGEVVSLFHDGVYVGRWPVTPWGACEIQIAFHPTEPSGLSNVQWSPGRHRLLLQGARGDRALTTITVADR